MACWLSVPGQRQVVVGVVAQAVRNRHQGDRQHQPKRRRPRTGRRTQNPAPFHRERCRSRRPMYRTHKDRPGGGGGRLRRCPSSASQRSLCQPPSRSPSGRRDTGPRRSGRERLRARAAPPAPGPRGSLHRPASASLHRSTSAGGSTAWRPTSSGRPPRSPASTGTPEASASSTEYGQGSSQRDGTSTTAGVGAQLRQRRESSRPVRRTSPPSASRPRRARSGPSPAITSGTPAARAASDRGVEALLLDDPARWRARSVPVARARGARRMRRGHEVGQDAGLGGRHPELEQPGRGGVAHGHQPVGVLEQVRLLAVQTHRVRRRLGQRAAAAQPQARPGVGAPAAEARRPVAVGDRDRAEQPEVVEVEHRAGAGRAGRGQRAPAEQRMDVVGVDDVGAQAAHGAPDLVGVQPAGGQRSCRRDPADLGARALYQLDGVPAGAQQGHQVGDRALLASLEAVPVMQQQDAHDAIMPHRGHRPAHHLPRRLPAAPVRAAGGRARGRGSLLRRGRPLHPGLVHRSGPPAGHGPVPGASP